MKQKDLDGFLAKYNRKLKEKGLNITYAETKVMISNYRRNMAFTLWSQGILNIRNFIVLIIKKKKDGN